MPRACLLPQLLLPLAVTAALLSSASAEPVPSAASATGKDWPDFLGPQRDSKSLETGLLADWPAAGPRLIWSRELGESYGIGSVSRGRYYQFDRRGDGAELLCLDAQTGRLLWTSSFPTDYQDLYGYNGGPRCSPIVDGDRIYLFGADGWLRCLQTDGGGLRWEVDTARRFGVVQNFFGVGSNPVIEGRLLIAMIGGSPPGAAGGSPADLDDLRGNGTGVVAFDKLTGEVVYRLSDELASYASLKLATIGGRRWCFAFARGGLLGFDPAAGKLDFHYPWRARLLESVNASTPVVVGDQVLISETYGPGSSLLRVRPGGYEVIWADPPASRERAMQAHWMTPVYHEGYLYGSSGRHASNAELRCIDWNTGAVQWSEPGLSRSSMLYVDGHFVCLTEYGELLLVKADPRKFTPVARVRLKDPLGEPLLKYPCWAAPILAEGRLYVRGRDRVACLELIPRLPER